MAGELAGHVDVLRHVGEREVAALLVVGGLGAGLRGERGGGRAAPGHHQQVHREAALGGVRAGRADHHARHVPPPARLEHRRAADQRHVLALQRSRGSAVGLLAQVGNADHLDAGLEQRERRVEAAVVDGRHDRARSRLERVHGDQPPGAAGEHHAREVVAGEEQRLLDRAGRVDLAPGADLMERVALPDRHEAVEGAERGRVVEDLDARLARPLGQLARVAHAALGEQPAARLGALVGEHHVGAQLGRGGGGVQAGRASPDHEDVGVAAAVLRAPLALGLRLAQLPEPGRVAQHLLVERPEAPRPDEGLVVEAGRGERAAHQVGGAHHVEVERRRRVHVLHLHPLAHRLGAGADAGSVIHLYEAVWALAGTAEETAGAVVFEATGEGSLARCEEGGTDRVPLQGCHLLAVEAEGDFGAAVDALPALFWESRHVRAAASSGSAVKRTSFVRVSRSAMNHSPQPERCTHHSR